MEKKKIYYTQDEVAILVAEIKELSKTDDYQRETIDTLSKRVIELQNKVNDYNRLKRINERLDRIEALLEKYNER